MPHKYMDVTFPIYQESKTKKARETLVARKAEIEAQIKTCQDAIISVPQLESFIRDTQNKLPDIDFEGKRLALDMLDITVWLDGDNVEITGVIEPEKQALRCVSNLY